MGASGSGKTSLIRCMTRLLRLTRGTIYVNQTSIEAISTRSLHALFGVVSQEVGLFCDTLLANLTYGTEKAQNKHLKNVLGITNLSDLVNRLPNGLNTMMDRDNRILSKGEMQRIALARCLLRPSQMYVLDEPTSALDMKNEEEIMERVFEYLRDRTIVVVTHQLSILKKAHQIVLMRRGRIQSIASDVSTFDKEDFI